MKKFFAEFKKFITRGNVVDLAVGVIVGGAFTSIVNGLSNYILRPLINWIMSLGGENGLESAITMLSPSYTTNDAGEKVLDLANSIYIDWGSFISAVLNFFIVAFVLFVIVKVINSIRDNSEKLSTARAEKVRARKLEKLLRKNEKLKAKGKPERPIPQDLLPPVVEEVEPEPEKIDPQIELLTEIRDLLKK